ncbi:hypothetical protein A2Y83_03175 [Candidatus Falkowbacteria bacterium RBG_13_39_14]|uniref:Metallo-beta-lactamase domain-containing protein n=1 Tax=Candidatus Falkowbacteria bacterium RBG_13_39_14 TaxID=1797985 RepID=A0A1F5S5K1_9BACT|nr:MAG: hypothetical protein A2Y83_03175 [Candidatus Falkowbacteria bacterium RBG_13_39_14]
MRKKKILIIILALIAINIYFLARAVFSFSLDDKMRVIFFDVGQGDASLVMADGLNILIDGGPDKKVVEKLDKYLPFWDREIDIMVLTHPHADHVAGLIDVFKKYQVDEVWMTGVLHSSYEYLEFLEIARDSGMATRMVGRDAINRVSATNIKIEILYPREDLFEKTVDNLNNSSIVLRISYKDKSFLFAGDIEEKADAELCEKPLLSHPLEGEGNIRSDVLKIAHHGSANASSQCFLEAVKPEITVISAGRDNDFGMPSLRILNRLERMGIGVFRTDEDGDVIMETDGKEIKKFTP